MDEFWKISLSVAGLGAVVSFVLWSTYRKWMSLPIFTTLLPEHQYNLFRLVIVLTFVFALAGLASYHFKPTQDPMKKSAAELIDVITARNGEVQRKIDGLISAFTQFKDDAGKQSAEQLRTDSLKLYEARVASLKAGNLIAQNEYLDSLKRLLVDYHTRETSRFIQGTGLLAKLQEESQAQYTQRDLDFLLKLLNEVPSYVVDDGRRLQPG